LTPGDSICTVNAAPAPRCTTSSTVQRFLVGARETNGGTSALVRLVPSTDAMAPRWKAHTTPAQAGPQLADTGGSGARAEEILRLTIDDMPTP
jgi:hypothetical protein